MRQALFVIRTVLVAAVIAFPLGSVGPGLSSGTSTIEIAESPGVPAAHPADPLGRSLAGLKARSLLDGPGAGPAAAPASLGLSLSLDLSLLHLNPSSCPAPVTGSARRLPALPTGPPSHG